jgi:hypothetical protein
MATYFCEDERRMGMCCSPNNVGANEETSPSGSRITFGSAILLVRQKRRVGKVALSAEHADRM